MSESTRPQKAKRNDAVKRLDFAVKEKTEQPFENYNFPDRTFSDYYCKVCISHMNSREIWASHVQGKRHQKNVKKVEEESLTQDIISITKVVPVIEGKLVDIKVPVVGLKYISEIRKFNQLLGPTYKCFLCSAHLATGDILIDHLSTSKHMLTYIKEEDHKSYTLLQDLEVSKESLKTLIIYHASKLELEHGRGTMTIEYEEKNGVLPPATDFKSYEGPSPSKIVQQEVQKPKRRRERSPRYELKNYESRTLSPLSLSDDNSYNYEDHSLFRPRRPSYEPPCIPKSRPKHQRSTTDSDIYHASPQYHDLREKLKRKAYKLNRQSYKMPRTLSPREDKPTKNKFRCYKADYKTGNLSGYIKSRAKLDNHKSSYLRDDRKRHDIQDILRKIRRSSPSATRKLLDKMAYGITNYEECQRFGKIARIIEASAGKCKLSSLNNDQNDLQFEYTTWRSCKL